MLESLMVFPNDNHFFNLPQHFDDGMAKLMQQQEQIETFIASASASPVQDYILAPVPSQSAHGTLQQHQQHHHHHHRPQAQPPSQPHLSPSYPSHPLDQNAMAFSNTMPQLIPSAPASPSYPIVKTESSEEHHFQRLRQHQQQQQVDFLMYPSFEMQGQQSAAASPTPPQHVVASQISSPLAITAAPTTPQRLAPSLPEVDLFHQRQQHQQQQQRHAHQLRMQHQQQQRMMEQQQQQQQHQFSQPPFTQSANTNMMIPVTTTTALSTMLDSVCSAPGPAMSMVQPVDGEHFVPATIATSMPLFESTQDSFQRPSAYASAKIHPASPSTRHEATRRASPTLMDTIPSPTISVAAVPSHSTSSSPVSAALAAPTSTSSRISTSSRLDKVKPSRTTRITKSSSSTTSSPSLPTESFSSTPTTTATTAAAAMSRAAKAASTRAAKRAAAAAASTTVPLSTAEVAATANASVPAASTPPMVYQHLPGSHGNVTHPRRAAQNRAAQRTFRNRRKAYIKDLEVKVQQLDSTKAQNDQLVSENQRLLQHAQQLEQMLSEAGFRLHPGMASLMEMDLSLTFKLSNSKDEDEDQKTLEASDDDGLEEGGIKTSSSSEEHQREQDHHPVTESNIQRLDIHPSL